MDKKRWMLVLVLGLVMLTMVSCQRSGSDTAGEVLKTISNVFNLKFIDSPDVLEGFTRLVVFLLIFTLLFFGSQQIGMGRTGGIVAFLIATISVVFIPGDILVLIGELYGTFFAWSLIAAIIFLLFFIVYYIPPNTWWGQLLRIFILSILLWIFSVVVEHAETLARVNNIVRVP